MTPATFIEPRTVLVVATLMVLLNGAVLGTMSRSLPPAIPPSPW